MSYRFVFGESGSGKTYKIMNDCISASLADESSRFLLIVPEQSTTAAEKAITALHPAGATDSIDVVSFNRLAYKVFEELDIKNPELLDDISKAMILRKLGGQHKRELSVWKNRFNKPGFVDNLKSMISEMYLYGIKPADIYTIPESELKPGLRNKLHDLGIMFSAFDEYIRDRYTTIEEIPDILSGVIEKSGLIHGTTILLDGFTGFTPVQYRIIESFLTCAKEVVVSVHIGEGEDPYKAVGPEDLFAMSRTMVSRIIDLGSRNGISETGSVFLPLRHRLGNRDITVACAANTAREIEYTAFDISRRIREGSLEQDPLRYRNIAVICASQDIYASGLKHEFDLRGIPYYFDEKAGISDNPVTAMISAALSCMAEDYSYDSFMRYLKSGFVTDDIDMVDCVDIYMYRYGRRGYKRMREDWICEPDRGKRDRLNSFKNEMLDTLEDIRNTEDQSMMPEKLLELLERLNVREKLERRRKQFETDGDHIREREYGQVYDKVSELLTRMKDLLQGEKIERDELAAIFETGASQIRIGMIPSGVDRVIIGDLTRTRLENIRVLYLIGANEGNIPKLLNRGSVISDTEKEILKKYEFEMAPTVRDDLLNQRYYVYRMLKKPTEHLTVSFSGINEKGDSLNPSYLISELCEKQGNGEADEGIKVVPADIDAVAVSMIEITHGNETISEEAARELYGSTLYASVTKLEQYMQCPYAFFAKYGLKLKKVEKFSVEAVDVGNIAHFALEKVFKDCKKQGREIYDLSDEEREHMVSDSINQALLQDISSKYSDTSRNKYIISRIERIVNRSLWAMAKQLSGDEFTPYEEEWHFSFRDNLEAMKIDLDDGKSIGLSGMIDRVDVCAREDDLLVRIIDYKSGAKKWDIKEVAAGNDLQLATYMDAVIDLLRRRFPEKHIVPASMYYYHLEDPLVSPEKSDDIPELILKGMKPSGIEFADEKQARIVMDYVRSKSAEAGQRILDGEIFVSPAGTSEKNACSFCDYRSLCGYDRKIKGCSIRTNRIKKEEAWDVIGTVDKTTD